VGPGASNTMTDLAVFRVLGLKDGCCIPIPAGRIPAMSLLCRHASVACVYCFPPSVVEDCVHLAWDDGTILCGTSNPQRIWQQWTRNALLWTDLVCQRRRYDPDTGHRNQRPGTGGVGRGRDRRNAQAECVHEAGP